MTFGNIQFKNTSKYSHCGHECKDKATSVKEKTELKSFSNKKNQTWPCIPSTVSPSTGFCGILTIEEYFIHRTFQRRTCYHMWAQNCQTCHENMEALSLSLMLLSRLSLTNQEMIGTALSSRWRNIVLPIKLSCTVFYTDHRGVPLCFHELNTNAQNWILKGGFQYISLC